MRDDFLGLTVTCRALDTPVFVGVSIPPEPVPGVRIRTTPETSILLVQRAANCMRTNRQREHLRGTKLLQGTLRVAFDMVRSPETGFRSLRKTRSRQTAPPNVG